MRTQLLSTKLYVPPLPPARVKRAHLIQKLNRGMQPGCKLILVSAPAGFGKTSLLSEWIAQAKINSAWLSLDEGDNDPVRFWDYCIAALRGCYPQIGEQALTLLHEPTPLPIASILVTLINEINTLTEPFAFVLDDYHAITTPAIHESLAFLIERLPPPMHLILTTRIDPPLPVARLRARNEIVELRAADLRFTPAESNEFLKRMTGFDLGEQATAHLEARTEGWIVGLQLAALAMRDQDDPAEFIATFAGDNQFILEYLGEELLDRQPESMQRFLMQTSILERFSGELCVAVTGQPNAQAILGELHKANFFIFALDDKRRWYRYHQLFADFLRHRLQQHFPDAIADLHRRASIWYEQKGYPGEAIYHALAMRDFERAAYLVESVAEFLIWRRAELYTLLGWLGSIPDEVFRVHPRLCLYHAWVLYLTSRLQESVQRIREAEAAIAQSGLQDDTVRGVLAAVKSTLTGIHQDFPGAIATSQQALQLLSESHVSWRCMAAINLGVSYASIGDMTEAFKALTLAMELSQEVGSAFALLSAFWHLATIQTAQLRLSEAEHTSRHLTQLAEAPGLQRFPVNGYIALLLGEIMLERNDLIAAERYLIESAGQINPEGFPMALLRCYTVLVRTKFAQGDTHSASEWLERAEQLAGLFKLKNRSNALGAYPGWHYLREGNLTAAWQWAQDNHLGIDDEFSYSREPYYLTFARLLIRAARNDPAGQYLQDALHLLNRLIQHAESSGRTGSLARALVLKALAVDVSGDLAAAVQTLAQALVLTEAEQCIRV
ncbi:MAG: helix-turn-helix transcriptional regulator, partial [Anaerolineae bacterium]|nr:helix-turn-helix transcriptional regulator [Anaerolineae bacterium]